MKCPSKKKPNPTTSYLESSEWCKTHTQKTTVFLKGADFSFVHDWSTQIPKGLPKGWILGNVVIRLKVPQWTLEDVCSYFSPTSCREKPIPPNSSGKSRGLQQKTYVTQTQLLGGGFNCFLSYHVFPNFQEWTFQKPWENANLVFSNHPLEMIEFLKVFCRWNLVAFGTFSNLSPQNRNWWLEWFLGKNWFEFAIHVQQSREPPSHLTSCWTLTATGMCTARCTAFARVETQGNATGIGWTSRTTWRRQTWTSYTPWKFNSKHPWE